jgi:hypothetical protein
MADGHAKLDEWIKMLRELPEETARGALPEVAEALREDLEATAGAGRAPDGSPWPPKKEDGGQALVGVTEDVDVSIVGTVVLVKLSGKFVRHHRGMARGGVRRQVIPTRKVPDAVGRAINKALVKSFQRVAGGGQ